MSIPLAPVGCKSLSVLVLSPHRLVPLALAAAGRYDGTFLVSGAAVDADEALAIGAGLRPDVFVIDPTAVSLWRMSRLLTEIAPFLLHPTSVALLLEPAQTSTSVAARYAWEAGIRCAMTSQEDREAWPIAIAAAARKATYVSRAAAELFELSDLSASFDRSRPARRNRGAFTRPQLALQA